MRLIIYIWLCTPTGLYIDWPRRDTSRTGERVDLHPEYSEKRESLPFDPPVASTLLHPASAAAAATGYPVNQNSPKSEATAAENSPVGNSASLDLETVGRLDIVLFDWLLRLRVW